MKTRDKLINAMNRANLSGIQHTIALVIYDSRGIDMASRYVEEMANNKRLEVAK